jgi:hypothetical protein
MVHRAGERSEKHHHLLDTSLGLSPGQVALLAILFLRGPQTLAELRARSERMHPFDTFAEVKEALAALTDRDEPLVALLERQPGRKESRYGQLLFDVEPAQSRPTRPLPDQSVPPDRPPRAGVSPAGLTLAGLAREVELLRAEVAGLRTQVDDLREGI